MSQSKELVTSSISPSFTRDLLPAAERTALLFQLTYLYLAGFPELEKMIRERALTTRLLFVSSERVMFKCLCTSQNLVKTLFPILKVCIQKNKVEMAKKYLAKAQGWITEIVEAAQKMVEEYTEENKELTKTTSTIYDKKTEKKKISDKMTGLRGQLEKSKILLQTTQKEKEAKQREIEEATSKRDNHISYMASCDRMFAARRTFSFWVFSWSSGPSESHVAQTQDNNRQVLKQLSQVLEKHMEAMNNLRRREQQTQDDLMAKNMEMMDLSIKDGSIPDPDILKSVKQCLVRIQNVLILMLRFWGHVEEILLTLEKKTFTGNDLLEDLEFFKEIYLQSITEAEEAWQAFGESCMKCQEVFDIQSKAGYMFLEMNPSTLSPEEKGKQISAVIKRLKAIGP
ncbi:uncharacterized protein LOC134439056 [Engraulis encrasicolus]|uniref:uncharacterized protein LOC134439056 n=1 Tax=Engraulis encrasicolus TaxID=184585 RepID=UPI002FCED092